MTDVLALQDDIAQAVTTALSGRLQPARPDRRHMPPPAAYELFLKGRAQLIRFTPDAWRRARTHFEEAIALDPQYAAPHGELALGYFISGMHGMQPMREVAPFVRAEVQRAIELDPSDPQPRFVLGAIGLAHDYDWQGAAAHFAASMQGPNVPSHARWIYASLYLRGFGRFDESAAEMHRAVQQDPLNATWQAIWGAHLIDAGRFDQAIEATRQAIELEPNYFVPQHLHGEALWAAGRQAEALASFERAYALAPWNAVPAGWLAAAWRHRGESSRAAEIVDRLGDAPMPLWGRVVYHLQVAELDAAAEWYARMIDQRDPFALVYARGSITRALREHHRWPGLAQLMKLPPV
jgi:tetratricopeptide (TPR) repeat protein